MCRRPRWLPSTGLCVDVDRVGRVEDRRAAQIGEGVVGLGEVEHAASRHDELVRTDLHVLGDCDGLAFVEDAEAVGLFDRHVHDVVLSIFPALHVGIFVHDQGAEVAAVEHHDVGYPVLGVEVDERRDQDAEGQSQVVGQHRGRGHVLVVAGSWLWAGDYNEYILNKVALITGFLLTEGAVLEIMSI